MTAEDAAVGTVTEQTARPDFMSMTPEELEAFVVSLGEKPYRAGQLFSWMAKGAPLDEMTNLSAPFRKKLAEYGEYRLPSTGPPSACPLRPGARWAANSAPPR